MNYFQEELNQDRHSMSADEYFDFYYHGTTDCVTAEDYLNFYQSSAAVDAEYDLEAEVQQLLRSTALTAGLGF